MGVRIRFKQLFGLLIQICITELLTCGFSDDKNHTDKFLKNLNFFPTNSVII